MEASLLRRVWNYFRVKSAVIYANKMHAATGKRHYVIKVFNKIRVYDRSHINYLINDGVLSQKLREAYELQKFCIHYTK